MEGTPISKALPTTSCAEDKHTYEVSYKPAIKFLPLAPGEEVPQLVLPEFVPYWHAYNRKQYKHSTLSGPDWNRQEKQSLADHRAITKLSWDDPEGYHRAVVYELVALRPSDEEASANEMAVYIVKFKTTLADANDHGANIPHHRALGLLLRGLRRWLPEFVDSIATAEVDAPSFDHVIQGLNKKLIGDGMLVDKEASIAVNAIRPTSHKDTLAMLLHRDQTRTAKEQREEELGRKKAEAPKERTKEKSPAMPSTMSFTTAQPMPKSSPITAPFNYSSFKPSTTLDRSNFQGNQTAMEPEVAAPFAKKRKPGDVKSSDDAQERQRRIIRDGGDSSTSKNTLQRLLAPEPSNSSSTPAIFQPEQVPSSHIQATTGIGLPTIKETDILSRAQFGDEAVLQDLIAYDRLASPPAPSRMEEKRLASELFGLRRTPAGSTIGSDFWRKQKERESTVEK